MSADSKAARFKEAADHDARVEAWRRGVRDKVLKHGRAISLRDVDAIVDLMRSRPATAGDDTAIRRLREWVCERRAEGWHDSDTDRLLTKVDELFDLAKCEPRPATADLRAAVEDVLNRWGRAKRLDRDEDGDLMDELRDALYLSKCEPRPAAVQVPENWRDWAHEIDKLPSDKLPNWDAWLATRHMATMILADGASEPAVPWSCDTCEDSGAIETVGPTGEFADRIEEPCPHCEPAEPSEAKQVGGVSLADIEEGEAQARRGDVVDLEDLRSELQSKPSIVNELKTVLREHLDNGAIKPAASSRLVEACELAAEWLEIDAANGGGETAYLFRKRTGFIKHGDTETQLARQLRQALDAEKVIGDVNGREFKKMLGDLGALKIHHANKCDQIADLQRQLDAAKAETEQVAQLVSDQGFETLDAMVDRCEVVIEQGAQLRLEKKSAVERAEKAEASGGDKLRELRAFLTSKIADMRPDGGQGKIAYTRCLRFVDRLLAEPAEEETDLPCGNKCDTPIDCSSAGGFNGGSACVKEQQALLPETCPEVLSWGVCAAPMPCKHHTPLLMPKSGKPADTERGEDAPLREWIKLYRDDEERPFDLEDAMQAELVRRELARGGK